MTDVTTIVSEFEEACNKKELPAVEILIQKIIDLSQNDESVNIIYSQAVVKIIETFKERLSSTKLKKMLSNIEDLANKEPENNELVINFAKALRYSLSVMSNKGQPNIMKELITNLENLALKNPGIESIQEELSEASYEMVEFWKKRGDFRALKERTSKFRELVKKFPNNELIKLNLSKSIVQEIDSSNKRDIKNVDNLLNEIQLLSESTPTNVGLQLEWVHAYRTAMDHSLEEPEDAKRWLESMKKIASSQKDEAFKIELAKGYLNAISSLANQNKEELTKLMDDLELLADTSKNNIELQAIYAQSLIISLRNTDVNDFIQLKDILDELEEISSNNPKNETLLQIYVQALVGVLEVLVQQQKADEMVQLVEKLEQLDKKYPTDEFVQQTFDQISSILKMIGFKKSKEKPKRLDFM